MMKRVLASVLVIACLLMGFALAESEYFGDMKVIKCKQAVNLRKGPGTETASLAQVPLDTVVHECSREAGSEWILVTYEDQQGYIRQDFLEDVEDPVAYANEFTFLDEEVKGLHITATRTYVADGEYMLVVCSDAEGNQIWMQDDITDALTEMTQMECFIGGTEDMPILYMYNAVQGLTARELATGETLWMLMRERVDLGAGICYVVDDSGMLYVAGYYGPDPVAIDMNGNVVWQSNSGSPDNTWLYNMELTDEGIVCYYGMNETVVVYDPANGNVVRQG